MRASNMFLTDKEAEAIGSKSELESDRVLVYLYLRIVYCPGLWNRPVENLNDQVR